MSTKSLTKSIMTPSLFNDFFQPWNEWFENVGVRGNAMNVPAVNVTEKNSHYLVSLAVPGLQKDNFDIDIEGNMLTISSEQDESKEEKDEMYTRKEYNYSSFSRSFTLPEDVKQDAIDATYENGVLKIKLPKLETTKKGTIHKSIAVK